jgi:hypothetical protein
LYVSHSQNQHLYIILFTKPRIDIMLVVKNVLGTDFCLNQADAWDFMGSGRVGTRN